MTEVKLKPCYNFTSVIQNIRKIPVSSILEKIIPIVYHNDVVYSLCDIQLKKSKKWCAGVAMWFNWNSGEFSTVGDPETEIVSIGHFGTKVVALNAKKQFYFLDNFEWVQTSIPPLPSNNLHDPVILTYRSFLLVIDGSTVWVHDDGFCNWFQFELSTPDGKLDSSPKNSFVTVAGKLFVCSSLKEMVYYVDLQEVMLDCSNEEEKAMQVLQLNCILKGANFIFLHEKNVLAIHTTSTTRMSSVFIDKISFYDVRCCHWHELEWSLLSTNIVKGCWLSLSDDCAGVFEIPPVPVMSGWKSWGNVKMHRIQLRNK